MLSEPHQPSLFASIVNVLCSAHLTYLEHANGALSWESYPVVAAPGKLLYNEALHGTVRAGEAARWTVDTTATSPRTRMHE